MVGAIGATLATCPAPPAVGAGVAGAKLDVLGETMKGMRSSCRAVALVLAAAVLVLAIGTAQAATWRFTSGELRFSGTLSYRPLGINIAECNITLTGTAVTEAISTLASGTRVGSFTRASLEECIGGTPRLLIEERAPWTLTYKSMGSRGPGELETMNLAMSVRFLAEGLGEARTGSCLMSATSESPYGLRLVAGTLWEYTVGSGSTATLLERSVTILGGTCDEFRVLFEGRVALSTNERIVVSGTYVYPAATEFGRVATESITKRTVTVASSSEATVTSIRVRSGNYFAITDPNRCVGSTSAAGGSCSFSVLFAAPAETGRALSDTVIVETASGTLEVAVRGST